MTAIVKLPDGGKMSLEGLTFGHEHRFVHGNWIQKLLRPLSPSSGWLGGLASSVTTASSSGLVFWTLRRPAAHLPDAVLRVTAAGDDGMENPVGSRLGRWDAGEGGQLEAWELPAFPRRGKQVRLRIYRRSGSASWEEYASFKVNSPGLKSAPAWTADGLPATRTAGESSVTLHRFTVQRGLLPARAGYGPRPQCVAELQCQVGGVKHSRWYPVRTELADSAGNSLQLRALLEPRPDGRLLLLMPGALWPEERVWKLTTVMARSEGFLQDETYDFPGIQVPAASGSSTQSDTATLAGYEVILNALAGKGARLESLKAGPFSTPVFHIRVRPASDDILVTAVEAHIRGRGRVRLAGRAVLSRPPDFVFALPPGSEGRNVDITVALQRAQSASFLVSARR